MGFNTSYILNEKLQVTMEGGSIEQLLLKQVADDLPFAQNTSNYETPNNPIIVPGTEDEWDAPGVAIHAPRIYFDSNWAETWRTYYMGADSDGLAAVGFASTNDPTGAWAKHPANPILTATESWEDTSYGVNGLSIAHVKGVGYVGFYGYRNASGLITTGKAISSDGINWTNKVPCVWDDKLAPYTSVAQITGAIWESENRRFVACLHIGNNLAPLMGAVVESKDGINWTTTAILSGGVSQADSKFGEPFDVFGMTKTGSTYVVFGHKWHTISYGDGNKNFKVGHYAVSTDLKNWWISEKPVGQTQSDKNTGRYASWVLGHDAWWGVHTVGNPLKVGLIRLPLSKPGYTYILNKQTIAAGSSAPNARWIAPDATTKKIGLTIQARYGATLGDVKIRIIPLFTPSATPDYSIKGTKDAHEFILSQTSANAYAREYFEFDNFPEKFAVEVVNGSGSPITDVTLRMSFKE